MDNLAEKVDECPLNFFIFIFIKRNKHHNIAKTHHVQENKKRGVISFDKRGK